ncbi:MAG: hypothetical protein ACPG47_05160, partial [Leucothrix sp.]
MAVCALAYLGVHSDKLQDWSSFATKLLGMQQVDRAREYLSFRMDDYQQRFVVSGESGDSLAFMGWEVEQAEDLALYAARLESNDIPVTQGSRMLADQRLVEDLIVFNDPAG